MKRMNSHHLLSTGSVIKSRTAEYYRARILDSFVICALVLIWHLQQLYHLLCASCAVGAWTVKWQREWRLTRETGLFRDNQFSCDCWRCAVLGRLAPVKMCTNAAAWRRLSVWCSSEPVGCWSGQHSVPASVKTEVEAEHSGASHTSVCLQPALFNLLNVILGWLCWCTLTVIHRGCQQKLKRLQRLVCMCTPGCPPFVHRRL